MVGQFNRKWRVLLTTGQPRHFIKRQHIDMPASIQAVNRRSTLLNEELSENIMRINTA